MTRPKRILVTGATGYVGSRLVPHLLDEGHQVRVLARDPDGLGAKRWRKDVEVCIGDVADASRLGTALSGIDAAYYLIHSMGAGGRFSERDVDLARTFGQAAAEANLQHIIYLGGLGEPGRGLSEHLRSRQETGRALVAGGVPVTEFRAAVIVGPGSISFEMIRYLTERIPLMICPRWVFRRIQPIGIDDVLSYLVAALDLPESMSRIVQIGGADVLTYGRMIETYARARGLRRVLLPVPVLTPKLSSHWVHWTTPVPAVYARPLIEGLRTEVVVTDDRARELFGQIHPVGYDEAIGRALDALHPDAFEETIERVLTQPSSNGTSRRALIDRGMILEVWQRPVQAEPGTVYDAFCRLGGPHGWLHMNWAWRFRAALDRLIGGVGMRRGRPGNQPLQEGDALDSFRVERIERHRMLRLCAEMKLPGAGWLQFEARPMGAGRTRLVLVVFYAPRGLLGLLYWYTLYPIHRLIFAGLLAKLTDRAERT